MRINELLKLRREELGYSITDLAEMMNVTTETITGWECGDSLPSLDEILRLSDIYYLSVDELIRGSQFFAKPYQAGNVHKYRNMILVNAISFFAAFLGAVTARDERLFFVLLILLLLPLHSIVKEDSWKFGSDYVEINHLSNIAEKFISIFKPKKYTKRYSYNEIESVNIIYVAYRKVSPFDVKPDLFYIEMKYNGNVSRLNMTYELEENIPMLVSFLSNKGVKINDKKNIVERIIRKEYLYTSVRIKEEGN